MEFVSFKTCFNTNCGGFKRIMRLRIAELANDRGLTFLQLSQIMDVTERTLYRWNCGEKNPNKSNFKALLKNLKCAPSDLFEFN